MFEPSDFRIVGNVRDFVDRLAGIAVPTLLVVGRFDECSPGTFEMQGRIANRLDAKVQFPHAVHRRAGAIRPVMRGIGYLTPPSVLHPSSAITARASRVCLVIPAQDFTVVACRPTDPGPHGPSRHAVEMLTSLRGGGQTNPPAGEPDRGLQNRSAPANLPFAGRRETPGTGRRGVVDPATLAQDSSAGRSSSPPLARPASLATGPAWISGTR